MTNSIKEKLVKLLELKSQNDEKLLELDAESRILRKKIYSDYQNIINFTYVLEMPFRCKGNCEPKNHLDSQFIIGYANGQKYCSTCSCYWITDLPRCYCCNQVLRKTSRYHRHKKETIACAT